MNSVFSIYYVHSIFAYLYLSQFTLQTLKTDLINTISAINDVAANDQNLYFCIQTGCAIT